MFGGFGIRRWFIRPGYAGAAAFGTHSDPLPDEYEFLVDQNGNNLIDQSGNLFITSNGLYGLKDQNNNTLIDQNGNTLAAYLKNQNF